MTLVSLLRMLQLYTHNAHNLLGGPTFFQDHEFLGELYPVYESEYDSIVERIIGLGKEIDLISTQQQAVDALKKCSQPKSYKDCYAEILKYEQMLCSMVEKLVKDSSQGTIQLLGDAANKSEMRQYKIKQRLK